VPHDKKVHEKLPSRVTINANHLLTARYIPWGRCGEIFIA